MFNLTVANLANVRRNIVSVINITIQQQALAHYQPYKSLSTTTFCLYNAGNGVNNDYDWRSGGRRTKDQGPSTVYRDPVRQVFISQSNDVFTNLALEDWLYKNHDFDHKVRPLD